MKKICVFLIIICSLVACQEPAQHILGSYSYKISGNVYVNGQKQPLTDEQGALNIVSRHDSVVLLTLNQMGGSIMRTDGTYSNQQLVFEDFERTIMLSYKDTTYDTTIVRYDSIVIGDTIILPDSIMYVDTIVKTLSENFDIVVSGEGEVLRETIIFMLDYEGQSQSSEATVVGSDILMVAKKN